MRQRNDTGYHQHIMAWPAPFEAAPEEIVDHPTLLAGFTEVPAAVKPKKTTAAPAATPEGGEPE